jgi:hypothetical protein
MVDFSKYLKSQYPATEAEMKYIHSPMLPPNPEGWIETLDGWFRFELNTTMEAVTNTERMSISNGWGESTYFEDVTRVVPVTRSIVKDGSYKVLPEGETPNPRWVGSRKRYVGEYK